MNPWSSGVLAFAVTGSKYAAKLPVVPVLALLFVLLFEAAHPPNAITIKKANTGKNILRTVFMVSY